MEIEPEEQQIVELLSKLKNHGGTYPKKLLASRREVFLGQMASVGMGLGIGAGLKTVTKSSKSGSLFHLSSLTASSLIEMVLVVAIVAQAGIIAYSYRDRIADLINSFSALTTPTAIVFPVTESSSQSDGIVSDTPTVVATNTITPTASPSNTVTTDTSLSGSNNDNGTTTNPNVTPTPPANGDNGNHYGQTPRPTQQKSDPKPTRNTGNENGNGNEKKP